MCLAWEECGFTSILSLRSLQGIYFEICWSRVGGSTASRGLPGIFWNRLEEGEESSGLRWWWEQQATRQRSGFLGSLFISAALCLPKVGFLAPPRSFHSVSVNGTANAFCCIGISIWKCKFTVVTKGRSIWALFWQQKLQRNLMRGETSLNINKHLLFEITT